MIYQEGGVYDIIHQEIYLLYICKIIYVYSCFFLNLILLPANDRNQEGANRNQVEKVDRVCS
jgi:hypothetical protein